LNFNCHPGQRDFKFILAFNAIVTIRCTRASTEGLSILGINGTIFSKLFHVNEVRLLLIKSVFMRKEYCILTEAVLQNLFSQFNDTD
jgi:hypothetical protein